MWRVSDKLCPSCLPHSKLTQDSRMESPIPILPLPTPDAETEKLIRMKDEEVSRAEGKEQGLVEVGGLGGADQASPVTVLMPSSTVLTSPPAKAHAGDAAEDEAANARPVTPTQPHIAMDRLPVSRLALPIPGPQLAWT